ncbi:hypothetical protein WMY93_001205 [Mugilogobius chulae]|uniref:Uncharacterized protein n=1 Tax=Mugilogobius chulae TaxID=88201 RepID=A0AAW0QC48_9GOBI
MAVRTVVIICAILIGMSIVATSFKPELTHAYCRIVWLIGVPCDRVTYAIVTQIKAMGSYKLLSPPTASLIEANHTSGSGQYESVNFTMVGTSVGMGCHVEGLSMSSFWYSLFDNGTNYCNLHNIIEGSGLSKAPGFVDLQMNGSASELECLHANNVILFCF